MAVEQSYEEWMDEDAERVNRLSQEAVKRGFVVGMLQAPLDLNEDGSLKGDEDGEPGEA